MNILIVSSFLPYPLHSGGSVRLYNLIKQIAKDHNVTLVCEKRSSQNEQDVYEIEKIVEKVITVLRKKQWSIKNIIKTGFSKEPFLLVGHRLPEMEKIIGDLLNSQTFDVIHVETFYVLQNVPKTDIPILLVEHNIEYQVYERYVQAKPFPLRILLNLDVAKIKRAERDAWSRADKVATVSEDDKRVVGRLNTEVIANGVDLNTFRLKLSEEREKKTERKILYIGDFKWIQNVDGAEYIISEVWPAIQAKKQIEGANSNLKLWLVGRNMPDSLKALGKGDDSIIFDDTNTQSTPEIFSEADILLSPKRVGGGTSYKILEAMAVGTPVITTPLGLEGLEVTKNRDVLVGETQDELSEAVLSLLNDEELYKKIATSGRKQIEKYYGWTSIAHKLHETYRSMQSSI